MLPVSPAEIDCCFIEIGDTQNVIHVPGRGLLKYLALDLTHSSIPKTLFVNI